MKPPMQIRFKLLFFSCRTSFLSKKRRPKKPKKQEGCALKRDEQKVFNHSWLVFSVTTCVLENARVSLPILCTRWCFCPSSATSCCSSPTSAQSMWKNSTSLERSCTWGDSLEEVYWWVFTSLMCWIVRVGAKSLFLLLLLLLHLIDGLIDGVNYKIYCKTSIWTDYKWFYRIVYSKYRFCALVKRKKQNKNKQQPGICLI